MTDRAELIEAARLLLATHRDVEAVELLMEPDHTEDGICSVLLQQLTTSSPQPTARVMAAMALRCEEGIAGLFPTPQATSLDELLRRQSLAKAPRLRASAKARPSSGTIRSDLEP